MKSLMIFCLSTWLLASLNLSAKSMRNRKYQRKKSVTPVFVEKPNTFAVDFSPVSLLFGRVFVKPAFLLSKTLEVPMHLEYHGSRGVLLKDYNMNYHLFALSSGVRHFFSDSDNSSYFEPLMGLGYLRDSGGNYFAVKGSALFGYMWRWDSFRLSLDLGGKYEHIFGVPVSEVSFFEMRRKEKKGSTYHYNGGFGLDFNFKIGWAF